MDLPALPKQPTPLQRSLAAPEINQTPTLLDAFKLARKMWLQDQRINLWQVCEDPGIGRATPSRWIGNKDHLLAEILWSPYEPIFQAAKQNASGHGQEYVADVYRQVMLAMLDAMPLQKFVAQDTPYALGILTASRNVQERRLESCKNLLEEQVTRGSLLLPLDLDTTVFVITRLNESFVYGDALIGTAPSIDKAVAITRVLTGGLHK